MGKKARMFVILTMVGATAYGGALEDIQSDSHVFAGWMSERVGEALAFQATSNALLPGEVLSFPSVEAGVSGGLSSSKIEGSDFRKLGFIQLDNSRINIPSKFTLPGAVVHAKVGLVGGFDVGVKFGRVDYKQDVSAADLDYESMLYGVEVRKKIIGGGVTGVALPDVGLSVGYDRTVGKLKRAETYNAPLLNGTNGLNAQTALKTKWDVGGVTARATASKDLVIVTPFVGLGFTKLLGQADTDIATVGTITGSGGSAISQTVTNSAKADKGIVHIFGGAELTPFPFLNINLGYLWSKEDWSANAGLRVQFP